ncbi:putative rrna-processing protein utp23 protein [Neofusicoccum parvum UCRNP2]|uniref:U three protein 23 n=1 Tax=Botryosphaeria parva (strain UCR-NP2) TaxID=1287680 RepID=R1GBU6_BOTPV|nr:putative rrna-processing protein utp23 protein [Neofusicoccum parvum UCRNP2]
MRGKRAKQYRKLMHQYALTFGFREPYQVLVDAEIVQDAMRMKIDLATYLTNTLQGKVKPMITQCSMRHLYAAKDQSVISAAQAFERRRCGHHTLDEPLSTLDCVRSVLDPKDSKTNKHRYVVATQDQKVRAYLRQIPGVPLIYINRSVMIMEPMAGATEDVRDKAENDKFRAGLKTRPSATVAAAKRKRDDDGEGSSDGEGKEAGKETTVAQPKKKKTKGPKAPNPLSVKKPKRRPDEKAKQAPANKPKANRVPSEGTSEEQAKRKRKRKNKTRADGEAMEQAQIAQEA